MKKFLLLVALFLAPPLLAQNSSPLSNFSLTGSASGFLGSSGGSQPASILGAWYQLTPRVSLGYETILVPTVATFDFGMAQYQLPLNALLGKKISAHFKFDASQVSVGFQGGIGKMLQGAAGAGLPASVSRIAETAGISLSYPLANHLNLQIVSAQFVHSGVQNGLVTSPSVAAISSGLGISF